MELFFTRRIEGDAAFLSGEEAAHCIRVMRHKVGDILLVTDGLGTIYKCEIRSIPLMAKTGKSSGKFSGKFSGKSSGKQGGADTVECGIVERSSGTAVRPYRLTMAVCPTKNIDRYEWFIEKATEFGIDTIVPLVSDHSIRTTVKRERLEAIALSAMKQSIKAYLPAIEEPVELLGFASGLASDSNALKMIAYCGPGDKKSIRKRLEEYAAVRKSPVKESPDAAQEEKPEIIIMIGPEGDFSEREIEAARQAGFLPITLGESRLRVETAALAAVSEIYFGCSGV